MRYWWLRSPSKLSTVSTICSSTRGPAMLPSLVTWPTSTTAVPRSLAKRTSSCAEARTWLTVPGAPSIRSRMHGLDRIDDEQRRRFAVADRGQDVAHRGRRRQPHRRRAEPQPNRAQPHLLGRFLARHIDDAPPRCRQPRRDLEQQGRLADARIAADQHRRPGDDPAADRPVELGKAARQPVGQRRRRFEPDQRDRPPAALEVMLGGEDARHLGRFLDQAVPVAAIAALPLPAVRWPTRTTWHTIRALGFAMGRKPTGTKEER